MKKGINTAGICCQKEFYNYSSVLIQTKQRSCDATARNDFHIDLDAFSGVSHLLVRFSFIALLSGFWRKQTFPTHDTIKAFYAAGVSTLAHAVAA